MTCRDVDLLRARGELTPEARKHLDQCAECRALDAAFKVPVPEPPGELQGRITQAILADLKPVSPLSSRPVLTISLLVLTGLVIALGAWYWEYAGWEALSRGQAAVMFSLLGTGILLMSDQAARLMVPGTKTAVQPWVAAGLPLTTLLIAVLFLFPYESDPEFFTIGLHCWLVGLACAGGTAPLVLYAIRRSASVTRIWQGATAGLLCGLVGAAVLEIACPFLERTHIIAWHLGAALTAMLTGVIASECLTEIQRRNSVGRP